jgi:hypothetical protein
MRGLLKALWLWDVARLSGTEPNGIMQASSVAR